MNRGMFSWKANTGLLKGGSSTNTLSFTDEKSNKSSNASASDASVSKQGNAKNKLIVTSA